MYKINIDTMIHTIHLYLILDIVNITCNNLKAQVYRKMKNDTK